MTFYTIYSKSPKTSYKSQLFSKSTLFYILCLIFNIFIPLFIVYKSDGFWRKVEFFREHPDIHFRHDLILVLHLKDPELRFKMWSTYPKLNRGFHSSHITVPFIRSQEIDRNRDGKYDQLDINLSAPLDPSDEVVRSQVILFFDYRLHSKISLQMESIVDIDCKSPIAGTGVRVIGDIVFNQKIPLLYHKHYFALNENTINSQEFFIEDMFDANIRSNFSTSLKANNHYNWYSRRDNTTKFEINSTLIYSEQLFHYRPGVWYVIKWAFIQYITIYLIIYLIIDKIKRFVFENKLLYCIESHSLVNQN